jgi:hypothetical protein
LIGAAIAQPTFAGLFVWRYYANLDDVSQEASWGFSPHGKLSEALLSNLFHATWAADPDPQSRMMTPKRVEKYSSSAPPATRGLAPTTPGSLGSGLSDMK